MTPLQDLHSNSQADSARTVQGPSIGPWQLGRSLGQGRWTDVYQAQPQGCPADWPYDYAVKTLRSEWATDSMVISLLQREAFVGRLISHGNLVSILAAHVDSPPFYLVTPYLPGATLARLMEQGGSLGTPRSLWFARQSAEALQTLHLQGWIHGDIKPSNIFISPHGHVTLIDLGFAQSVGSIGKTDPMMGTPRYTSPESFCTSHSVGAASDVYSLGVTLYETLTGQPPFCHDDPWELATAHLQQPPRDVRALAPQIPTRVARLVRRMLAKDPLRRPDADELVALLVELEIDSFGEWEIASG